MPAPTSIDEFLDLVRKSGILDEARLDTYLEKLRASPDMPAEPAKLADRMVRDALLTNFHVEQLMAGKWRRFQVGKYKVLERLGAGGMGSVFLCEHKFMRRRAAVKILPVPKANDPSALERFYREARAVAALDHPNIVRAYDIDQDDKLHFLVMEYVDGANLQEIIKRTGPMDPLRAAHYMRQSALGLQHAHETASLIHRDIKPGNILVDRNGTVKILDMGLARFFYDEQDQITQKYDENVLGTADYLAPEQALDSHSVDIRADIYSLGATFYFCLTGRTPFAEGSIAQKLIWHQTRQPKPIKSFRTDVPDELLAVLDKMMAKQPEARFQTPQELADALEPMIETPIPPPPIEEMPQLSPAAMGNNPGEGSSSKMLPKSPAAPAPRQSKNWQVPPVATPKPKSSAPRPTTTPRPASPKPVSDTKKRLAQAPALPPSPKPAPGVAAKDKSALTAEPPRDEEGVGWDKLGADTEDPSAQVDTAPRPQPRKAPVKKAAVKVSKRRWFAVTLQRQRLWWLAGGAVVVVLLIGIVLWWGLARGR